VEPIKSGTWTVQDIDTYYHGLGIPHFQRGLVWGSEATSLLLESVFFDTPCGAIILWEPEDPTRDGQPLPGASALRYLVVDGQQRVRSLHGVLAPSETASESPGGEDEKPEDADGTEGANDRVWCVNLCRVPGLESLLDDNQSRYPLFRFVVDPNRKDARFKKNLIPVRAFLEGRTQEYDRGIEPRKGCPPESVLREMVAVRLARRVSEMKTRELFTVKVLREDTKSRQYHLPEVVMLYNRINSAGKRVESEEKAFAALVSVYSETSKWLGDVFESVHGKRQAENAERNAPAEMPRDEVLRRKKERNFGFKLFIRTFIQVCAYRFDYSIGSNSFSFEVLNNSLLQHQLKTDPESAHLLFEKTKKILTYVRSCLLGGGLRCDDLQMLPDTTSLLPLFQVLIRFPRLMNADMQRHERVLQSLALRLFLASDQSQDAILGLVRAVNKVETADAALRALDKGVASAEMLRKDLPKRLTDSNSLQDRYTLMLYWLLRGRDATDLSYKNLEADERMRMVKIYGPKYEQEVPIDETVLPEKQHLVPYSQLEKLYGIVRRGRVSRHVANNIGNITYISQALNSFKTGLGHRPAKLEEEPADNAGKHFLAAPEVRRQYALALRRLRCDGSDGRRRAQKTFEKLCELRRKQIAEAFAQWARDLAPSIGISDRIVPEARFTPRLEDRIRQLGYHDDIEDALLGGVASGWLGLQKKRGKDAGDGLVLELLDGPKKRGCEIWLEPAALHLNEKGDSDLCARLREIMVTCGFREDGTDWSLETENDGVTRTKQVLEKLHQTR
jgi:hypothetical protein